MKRKKTQAGIEGVKEVPDVVQADIDVLVTAAYGKTEAPDARARIIEWLSSEGSSLIDQAEVAPDSEMLSREALRYAFANIDRQVREWNDLDDDAVISDNRRLAHFEEHILPDLFDEADSSSVFVPVTLTSHTGESVVMVAELRGYSFSGVMRDWEGPHTTDSEPSHAPADPGWVNRAGWKRLSRLRKLAMLRGEAPS